VNLISDAKANTLRTCFLAGDSIRNAARTGGVSKLTAEKFYKDFKSEGLVQPLCGCGKEAGHNGWCSHRYKQSQSRQTFMEHWNKPKNGASNEMPLSDGIIGEYPVEAPRELMKDGEWIVPESERPKGWERMVQPFAESTDIIRQNCKIELSEEIGQLNQPGATPEEVAEPEPVAEPMPASEATQPAFDPSAVLCKCGKPANHKGRCKGSGFPKASAPKQKPLSRFQWILDRLAVGEDPVLVQVPEGAAARVFIDCVREELQRAEATGTVRFRFNWKDGKERKFATVDEALEFYETSYSSPSNEEAKEEVAPPIALPTPEIEPKVAVKDSSQIEPTTDTFKMPRSVTDAERELIEKSVLYHTHDYGGDDFTWERLIDEIDTLAHEVKYRREAEAELDQIDKAVDWEHSKDPVGDAAILTCDALYRFRVMGIAEGEAREKRRHPQK
jgi:hypothetical protein